MFEFFLESPPLSARRELSLVLLCYGSLVVSHGSLVL